MPPKATSYSFKQSIDKVVSRKVPHLRIILFKKKFLIGEKFLYFLVPLANDKTDSPFFISKKPESNHYKNSTNKFTF